MGKEEYDEIAQEYAQMLNPTKRYVLIPTFQKIIGDVKGKSVLDLACGEGFFTRILAILKPSEILGIDFSVELIKKAIEKEKQDHLGIKYEMGDALSLKLNRKFELITAVYLLNYALTKEGLLAMCKNIYGHLKEKGRFSAITANPALKQMANFEYERRFTNPSGKDFFTDGDKIRCEMKEEGKTPFEFTNVYWSKETYEQCLRNAGFKSILWVDTIISSEGIKRYGNEYWDKFRKNPSPIAIICEK